MDFFSSKVYHSLYQSYQHFLSTQEVNIDKDDIYYRGRRKVQAEAKSLFCYWAVCELGMSRTFIANQLGMTQQGVGYAVNRGEKISKENNFQLIDLLILWMFPLSLSNLI